MKTAGRRVLLAWELGGNLGHLSRLMAIARMVEDAGGTPVWALPAHAVDSPWLAEIEHPRLQTPDSVEPGERLAVLSFASILLNVGFSRPDGIARAIGQWRALLKEVRPDLIVLDTAPVAQLVACLDGWPALVVSNGFDSPPATCPTFGIGLRGPFAERLNAGHLQRFASSLDAAARLSGVQTAPSLHHYFSYPTRYLDCVAETDPYGARDDVVYTGPLIGLPRLDSPRWLREPGRCSLNVFAYLQTAPTRQAVLRALSDLDANTLCITDDRGASNLALPGTRVLTSPVQLDAAIRHADLVVGYGS